MARRKKRRKGHITEANDPIVTTKRWLRKHMMQAARFWAPILRLDSFVDEISLFIAEKNDPDMDQEDGAFVCVDSSRRTADIKMRRSVIAFFKDDYHEECSPEEIVETTILHELIHIVTHPMSEWAHSTIGALDSSAVLEGLFSKEEEVCVEHLTRVLFGLKESLEDVGKFKGKIIYLAKDRKIKEK